MIRAYDLVSDRMTYAVEADQTVYEAARLMTERSIGALPVLTKGELVGMFSERDIVTRVVAAGRAPGATKVGEVMTTNPRAISTEDSVDKCLFLMREFGFRHLPICEGKTLKGLVSLRDIMFRELDMKDAEIA